MTCLVEAPDIFTQFTLIRLSLKTVFSRIYHLLYLLCFSAHLSYFGGTSGPFFFHNASSATTCHRKPSSIDPTALTAAISEALRPNNLLDILIHALSDAITDTISHVIHEALEFELQSRDRKIVILEKDVHHLSERLSEQEQCSRRNALIVQGMPESPHQPENKYVKIIKAAKQHTGVELCLNAIDQYHCIGSRLNKSGNPQARPIVVKFVDYNSRANLHRFRAEFKGSDIYVNESLTQGRQSWLNTAKLHPATDKLWTQVGRMEIRHKNGTQLIVFVLLSKRKQIF